MPLFQEAIIKKHLSAIDETLIDSAYSEYKRVYSPEKIKNIKVAKEEQYQEGFIKDVFGAVLGYSVYPESPFNIETERKNETNSKKADGAILKDEKVVGVIELKDNKTKNLDSVKDQAFGYKNNHKECSYVISSNFHKLRFYIDDATEYEEFDLYNLDKETFKRFYLYLRKEGLLDKNLPKLLRQETKFHEEEISKKLYKDYTGFKQSFFENAVKNNPQYDKLLLFKKSQKFLDRILFLLFAEDKGLVGTNSIVKIVEKWSGADDDYYRPLYEMVNTYFGHLYRGYTYQKTGEVIPQFGGELFAPDEVLDVLTIDDAVLKNDLLVLSKYDFNTDVDVNILGHIFEHSLNEVDDVEASLRGETPDKTKSKRKKDGVFYTPKYITKYIVDNTLGKLCAEKKAELKLDGDIAIFEYQKADGKLNEKGKDLYERLNAYKAWLLTVKVCDPACGSGAFLNQALSFFIDEHRFIDDLVAELTNTPLRLFDTDLQILENNIYGVDINEESVEIAKLSLWLRTAQPGRKLSDLSANIKCGNSLIDDPAVAGDKAFNWQQEFPAVFGKTGTELGRSGGFDVVIGNPPYVQLQSLGAMSESLKRCGYETFDRGGDLYCLFTERGYTLLRNNGLLSFIMPNKWMLVAYGKPLRKFLSKTGLQQILNFGDVQFFQDAATIVCIFVTQKKAVQSTVKVLSLNQRTYSGDFLTAVSTGIYDYPVGNFTENEWSIQPYADAIKLQKMKENGVALKALPIEINYGIKTGFNDAFYIDEATRERLIAEDPRSAELIHKMLRGRDIIPYGYSGFEYLISTFPSLKLNIDNYPAIKKHLLSFGFDRLKQTGDQGARKKTRGEWFETQDSIAYWQEFQKHKIIYPNMTSVFPFMYDESGLFINDKGFILSAKEDSLSLHALLGVFNSSLGKLWIWYNCPELLGGTREIRKVFFENMPIPVMSPANQALLDELARNRIEQTSIFQSGANKFGKTLMRNFELESLSAKLESWYDLDFTQLKAELKKIKVKMTLSQESEWAEFFEEEQKKLRVIQSQIAQTDREIDRMVYALYGLTEEEIRIVESA
jgi:hypothetical protein